MKIENISQNPSCQTCYRIACRQCDWVASEEEVVKIQKKLLIACPVCEWRPGKES